MLVDPILIFLRNASLIGIQIYQFLLLIYIISSWFGGLPNNAFSRFVIELIRPPLHFIQKYAPFTRIGVIDLSPLVLFFTLSFLESFLQGLF